jgi:hypothetical protein
MQASRTPTNTVGIGGEIPTVAASQERIVGKELGAAADRNRGVAHWVDEIPGRGRNPLLRIRSKGSWGYQALFTSHRQGQ